MFNLREFTLFLPLRNRAIQDARERRRRQRSLSCLVLYVVTHVIETQSYWSAPNPDSQSHQARCSADTVSFSSCAGTLANERGPTDSWTKQDFPVSEDALGSERVCLNQSVWTRTSYELPSYLTFTTLQGRPTPDLVGQFSEIPSNAYQTPVSTRVYKHSVTHGRSLDFTRSLSPTSPNFEVGRDNDGITSGAGCRGRPGHLFHFDLRLAVVADQVAVTLLL